MLRDIIHLIKSSLGHVDNLKSVNGSWGQMCENHCLLALFIQNSVIANNQEDGVRAPWNTFSQGFCYYVNVATSPEGPALWEVLGRSHFYNTSFFFKIN